MDACGVCVRSRNAAMTVATFSSYVNVTVFSIPPRAADVDASWRNVIGEEDGIAARDDPPSGLAPNNGPPETDRARTRPGREARTTTPTRADARRNARRRRRPTPSRPDERDARASDVPPGARRARGTMTAWRRFGDAPGQQ